MNEEKILQGETTEEEFSTEEITENESGSEVISVSEEAADGLLEEVNAVEAAAEEPPDHPFMGTRMMRLDFRYIRDWYYYTRRPGFMKKLYAVFFAILGVALVSHFFIFPMHETVEKITLLGVVALAVYFMYMDQDGRKLTASDKKLMGKYQRMTFKTRNIFVEWQGMDQVFKYPYDDFVLYVDAEEAFILFLKRNVALVVPKRDVTLEMLQRVSERLDEKMGRIKWKRGMRFGL